MFLTNLYAELQVNPRSVATYRDLANQYRQIGMSNEAEAFLELIKKKFNEINTPTDQKQREDNQSNS